MAGTGTKRYPAELKERAVRMVTERPSDESEWPAIQRVSPLLGIGSAETLRKWVRQAEADAGAAGGVGGVGTAESEELRRLPREVAELKRANSILKAASAFFAAELDRPRG